MRGNLVHHTTGAGLHQHYGTANTVEGNTFACAGDADGDVAISVGEVTLTLTLSLTLTLILP